MKFFAFLSLMAFCAYQLASIDAASTLHSRQKRLAINQECPKDAYTDEACEAYAKRIVGQCSGVQVGGGSFSAAGCPPVPKCFDKDDKQLDAIRDPSKPYPGCCAECPKGWVRQQG